jgi:ClpX C4-type zinc finger
VPLALRLAIVLAIVAAPHRVSPDWRPPWELHRDSPRLPVTAWQQLDRAFDELAATLDDPDADLRAHAHGYEQLATAARHVAGELAGDETDRQFSSELARCAFCGKAARDVKKIITGPHHRDLRRVRRPLRLGARRRARRQLARSTARLIPGSNPAASGDILPYDKLVIRQVI